MQHYWAKLLGIIFPQTDDEQCITSVTQEAFAKLYSVTRIGSITALTSFGEKKVRAAIHLNKFHAHKHARILLASLLEAHLHTLPTQEYLLIPIPLSSKREQKRGYNQVTLVAEEMLHMFPHITLSTHVLQKRKHTVAQTSLTRTERLKNLHEAFFVPEACAAILQGQHIILLDDVTTTGTTLREAKATLLPHHPASILCIALAH
jgi:ComF family protein